MTDILAPAELNAIRRALAEYQAREATGSATMLDALEFQAQAAVALPALLAHVGALTVLHEPISDTYACDRCGRRDGLDCVIPNQLWNQIRDETGYGVLCAWCLDAELAKRGLHTRALLAFSGKAISAGTEPDNADPHWEAHLNALTARVFNAERKAEELTALCQTVANHVTRATLNVSLQSTSRPRSSVYWGDLNAAWIALHDAGFRCEGSLDPLVTLEVELRDELGRKEDRIAELTALVREFAGRDNFRTISGGQRIAISVCAYCGERNSKHTPECPMTRAQALGEGNK